MSSNVFVVIHKTGGCCYGEDYVYIDGIFDSKEIAEDYIRTRLVKLYYYEYVYKDHHGYIKCVSKWSTYTAQSEGFGRNRKEFKPLLYKLFEPSKVSEGTYKYLTEDGEEFEDINICEYIGTYYIREYEINHVTQTLL